MRLKKVLFLCLLTLLSTGLYAQSARDNSVSEKSGGRSKISFSGRKTKKIKKRRGFTPNSMLAPDRNEFLEKRLKEKAKIAEEMKTNPQYADKMYFGHKRPPKKRPVGKRKLCKECGIVH
jgi:hypothetical protein